MKKSSTSRSTVPDGNRDTGATLGRPPKPAATGATDQDGQVRGAAIQGRTGCTYNADRSRFCLAPPDAGGDDDDGRANSGRREGTIGDDLDRFLDMYRLITSRDPGADEAVDAATAERLLVGDGWRTPAAESGSDDNDDDGDGDDRNDETTDSDGDETTGSDGDDRAVLDARERVDRWMKRLQPMVSRIESVAREYETIVGRTSPRRRADAAGLTVAATGGPSISRAYNHTDRGGLVFVF